MLKPGQLVKINSNFSLVFGGFFSFPIAPDFINYEIVTINDIGMTLYLLVEGEERHDDQWLVLFGEKRVAIYSDVLENV